MNEYGLDSSVGSATPSPNFEDERTLQSARRVVPLEKITTKAQRRRKWFLGGAFAMAMTLGAASALLASYLKLRNLPSPVTEVSQADVLPAPVAMAETTDAVPADSPVTEEVLEPEPVPEEPPKKAAISRRRTIEKHNNDTFLPPHAEKASEEEELNRIRDAVLFDEWQERRARRVMRRERRLNERLNHRRDLSNLDEIFEGRRRP